ncbi:MAG: ribonuclease HII [Candidatus Melainabacteria bacterium]|nr:ribonuclease HII [Candidatus Melainabacteria bacterium]
MSLFKQAPIRRVIGVDEVGRGCLAGPVVACAAILPDLSYKANVRAALDQLNDSKALKQSVREALDASLQMHSLFAIGVSTVEEIDEINILQASLLAMRRAIDGLMTAHAAKIEPHEDLLVLIDGNKSLANLPSRCRQMTVVKGDATSASIASASVIAKVYRDRLMARLSEEHPHYGWDRNKGYGSKAHREAIAVHGITQWHRKSFRLLDLDDADLSDGSQEPDYGEIQQLGLF